MLIKYLRFFLIQIFSFCFITIILSSCNWQKCKATGLILIKPNQINIKPGYPNSSDEKNIIVEKFEASSEFIKIKSEPTIQSVIDQLRLENDKQEPLKAKDFSKNLEVKQIKNTDIISVSYRYSNLALAQQIVNTLMDEYIKAVIRKYRQPSIKKADPNKNIILPRRLDPVEIIQVANFSCSPLEYF